MCFAEENEEFRTRYDSYSKEIEYYTDRVEQIFRTIGIDHDYTRYGIQRNVEEWYSAKEPIFEILRNHPMWNEEAKAIVFLRDEVRGSDLSAFKRDINELVAYTSRKIIENELEQSKMFDAVISLLSQSASREISEREAELINRLGYYKEMRSGMKRSRVINTVFKEYPIGDDRKIDATKFTDGHEEGDRNYLSYKLVTTKNVTSSILELAKSVAGDSLINLGRSDENDVGQSGICGGSAASVNLALAGNKCANLNEVAVFNCSIFAAGLILDGNKVAAKHSASQIISSNFCVCHCINLFLFTKIKPTSCSRQINYLREYVLKKSST